MLADSDGSRKKSKTKMEIGASERGKVPYLKAGRVGDNKDELRSGRKRRIRHGDGK